MRTDDAKVDDVAPLGGDFNIYGGLYRPVRLLVNGPVCILPLDHGSSGLAVFQKKVSEQQADLEVRVQLSRMGRVSGAA